MLLQTLGYFACLIGIGPAISFAFFFWAVDKAASAPGLPGLGRLALKTLEFIGTPWKLLLLALSVIGLVAAGLAPQTRGFGFLAVGIIGLACLIEIIFVARPRQPGEFVILVPSSAATLVSLWWAWSILIAA